MKLNYLFLALFGLLLGGCMDAYLLKNYKPPKDFYDIIKNKTEDRTVNVKLKSGKVYETDKLKVDQDSTSFIYSASKTKVGKQTAFSKADIKDIKYVKFDPSGFGNTAEVTLNSGEKILGKNLASVRDSVFINYQIPLTIYYDERVSLPTSGIKTISFNNHWKGMAEYAGIGSIAGLLVGIQNDANLPALPFMGGGAEPGLGTIFCTVVGTLAGSLIGSIIGSTQELIIESQPEPKGLCAIGIIGGISISGINSSLDNNSNLAEGDNVKYSYGGYVVWSFNKNFSLRAELFKTNKGGSYETPYRSQNFYTINYITTVYLNFLELPILFQYSIPSIYFHPRFYVGPAVSIFNNGSIDKTLGDNSYPDYSGTYKKNLTTNDINNPDFDIILGAGINLKRHITIDLRYDWGLRTLSNNLFEGLAANLKQHAFSVMLGYEF